MKEQIGNDCFSSSTNNIPQIPYLLNRIDQDSTLIMLYDLGAVNCYESFRFCNKYTQKISRQIAPVERGKSSRLGMRGHEGRQQPAQKSEQQALGDQEDSEQVDIRS